MDDCCETYDCGGRRRPHSSHSAVYKNDDEFDPADADERRLPRRTGPHGDIDGDDNGGDIGQREKQDSRQRGERFYDEGGGDDDDDAEYGEEHQRRLEKTVLHKAMIGIGPYLVEKAASVLSASRSYSGDLSYHHKQGNHPQRKAQREGELRRKRSKLSGRDKPSGGGAAAALQHNHNADEPKLCNSRSQSLTKGFHKLRLSGQPHHIHNSNHHRAQSNTRRLGSSGGSTSQFKFQRGFTLRKVNNKSSSTTSVGRKRAIGGGNPPAVQHHQRYPEGSVNQRLASAKRSMIKELKSRVTQLENQLKESLKENQILQRMQHRHEIALSKYEGAEAELPKMIRSHLAEVRTLQENLRKAHSLNRNIDERMKARDAKIFRLEEENKALLALVKQNNLEERSKLAKQLEQARADQMAAEARVADLQRHIEMLEKNHRHQINVETKKLRNCNSKLFEAHQEIDKLYMALKEHERVITCMRMRQGQSQIPGLRIPSIQIFRDDASVRSSRTLPANRKSAKARPSDNNSLQEDSLRRQHSDTFDSSRRDPETCNARSKHHLFYANYSGRSGSSQQQQQGEENKDEEEEEEDHVSSKTHVIHPRPAIPLTKSVPVGQHTPAPLSPPSPSSSRHTASQSQSAKANMREQTSRSDQAAFVHNQNTNFKQTQPQHAGDGGQTNRTEEDASEKSELGIDDEYYNFEDVSVEDDNYNPQKSLFIDAVDSSCNVSSICHSPQESMRDPQNFTRLHPSSNNAGNKCQPRANLQACTKRPLEQQAPPAPKPPEQHQTSTIPPTSTNKTTNKTTSNDTHSPKAFKRHADGEVVNKLVTGITQLPPGPRPDTIISLDAEDGFVSQRSTSLDETASAHQNDSVFTTSAESESEDGNSTRSDYSKSGSAILSPKPGLTSIPSSQQQQPSSENNQDDKNYSLIESVFQKWKQNKSTPFQASLVGSPLSRTVKEETTPRRKEELLKKMKEIDSNRKKPDDATPLSNPAYFPEPRSSLSSHATTPVTPDPTKTSPIMFKNTYQPFFNVNVNDNKTENQPAASLITDSRSATAAGGKIKSSVLPWLQINQQQPQQKVTAVNDEKQVLVSSNSNESKIVGLKKQHSSILEPRHAVQASVTAAEMAAVASAESEASILASIPNTSPSLVKDQQQLQFTSQIQQSDSDAPRKKFTIGSISSLQGNVQPSQIPSRIPKASRSRPNQPSWK